MTVSLAVCKLGEPVESGGAAGLVVSALEAGTGGLLSGTGAGTGLLVAGVVVGGVMPCIAVRIWARRAFCSS